MDSFAKIIEGAPPGMSPFQAAADVINRLVYDVPSPQHRINFIVITSVAAVFLVLALMSLALVLFNPEARAKSLWIYRVVYTPRTSVPYIVPNGKLINLLMIPITYILSLVLYIQLNYFRPKAGPASFAAPVIASWFVPWFLAFDAVIVVWVYSDSTTHSALKHPVIINTFCWIVPFLNILSLVPLLVVWCTQWRHFLAIVPQLIQTLERLGSLPESDVLGQLGDLLRIYNQASPYLSFANTAYRIWWMFWVAWAFFAAAVFAISLFILLRVIQRQLVITRRSTLNVPQPLSSPADFTELVLKVKHRQISFLFALVVFQMLWLSGGGLWGIIHFNDFMIREGLLNRFILTVQWPIVLTNAVLVVSNLVAMHRDTNNKRISATTAGPIRVPSQQVLLFNGLDTSSVPANLSREINTRSTRDGDLEQVCSV